MASAPIPMAIAGSERFEGRYVRGAEVSSFTRRGGHDPWWVDPALMTGLPALEPDAGSRAVVDADVVVVGWLSVPGRYGHLDGYLRELRVHRVISAAPHDATSRATRPAPDVGRPIPWIDERVPTLDVGRLSGFIAGSAHPGVAEVVVPEHDLVRVLEDFETLRPGARVAVVRGAAVANRLQLFDALRVGLGDLDGRDPLEWAEMADRLLATRAGSAGPVAVAVLDAEELMLHAPDEFEAAVRHLQDATVGGGGGAPFHVLLHTTERFGSVLRSRLHPFGDEIPRLDAASAMDGDLAALGAEPRHGRVAGGAQDRAREVDGVIYDSTPVLEYQRSGFADDASSAEAAILAIDAFRPDVLLPLDFGMTVACLDEVGEGVHDPDQRPGEWHRYLRVRDLPDDLDARPLYRDATVVEVAAVNADAMRGAATRLLDQTCDHRRGTALGWTEMYVAAAWLPLPAPDRFGGRRSLVLDDLDGHRLALAVPLTQRDGGLWVGGPRRSVGLAPVELSVHNDGGLLQLSISIRWSLWLKQDEPGRRAIDDVLERLAAEGWRPR